VDEAGAGMKAQWKVTLAASEAEALLAVDLYNQPKRPRRLEGFFVHMQLAWLYLFQARYQRDRLDYHYRKANGRYERIDGEPKTWDLSRFVRAQWPDNDPARKNLELNIALRNKIEHRYEDATAVATAGYAQALLLNFEDELTKTFGSRETLADDLRFPVFIGTFTRDGAARIAAAQQRLPKRTKHFLASFQAGLDPAIVDDQRYEFRVHLIPKTGPKTDADVALTFVRATDLSDDQRQALADIGKTGTVIVREQIRDVVNADKMKPSEAAKKVQDRIPFKFSVHSHFRRAWRALEVRPPGGDPNPERTRSEFCVYDRPHQDYLYTQAFVDKVATKISTDEGFRELLGLDPVLKTSP
jgi:hypothetical protein